MSEQEDIEIIDNFTQNDEKKMDTTEDLLSKKNGEEKRKSDAIANKLQEVFNMSISLKGIQFTNFQDDIYCEGKSDNSMSFGENACVLYRVDFTIFYFRFRLKVLSLQYADANEILKIDIALDENDPKSVLTKELESCFKALRRRRSPTLLFNTLINFTKAVESRRLIILLVLRKHFNNFKFEENTDGGIILNYANSELSLKVGLFWSITVNSMHKIRDVIYMYQNNLELQHRDEIQSILKSLGHPEMHFITKCHLWKHLVSKLFPKPCKNLKRKQANALLSNNISTSVIPSTSGESLWTPYQLPEINSSVQNLSVNALRYFIPSVAPQTPFGMFNRYGSFNSYLQTRFQPYNLLPPTTLRRQQQYSTRTLSGSHQIGNNPHPLLGCSFHGNLPTPENASSSHTQTSSSTQPQNLSSHESDHSLRRTSQNQRSKFYQKYNKYRNQKHLRSPYKSGSSQHTERSSVIQTSYSRYSKRRRGLERSKIVEPDVEIIDMSNPSSSQKVSSFIKTQESQVNSSVITKVNMLQDTNTADVAYKTDSEVIRNLGDANTQIICLNNNVEQSNSNGTSTNVSVNNIKHEISKDNLCAPIAADDQCEVVRKTKKFNPFSLKFKDKLQKTGNNTKKQNNQTDLECVLVLSDNEGSSKARCSTKEVLSKKDDKIVYIHD